MNRRPTYQTSSARGATSRSGGSRRRSRASRTATGSRSGGTRSSSSRPRLPPPAYCTPHHATGAKDTDTGRANSRRATSMATRKSGARGSHRRRTDHRRARPDRARSARRRDLVPGATGASSSYSDVGTAARWRRTTRSATNARSSVAEAPPGSKRPSGISISDNSQASAQACSRRPWPAPRPTLIPRVAGVLEAQHVDQIALFRPTDRRGQLVGEDLVSGSATMPRASDAAARPPSQCSPLLAAAVAPQGGAFLAYTA